MIEGKLGYESEKPEMKYQRSSEIDNYTQAHHFPGFIKTEEITKLIEITQNLAEIMNLSEKDCEIIYKTYVKITQRIRDSQNGIVYFSAKYTITLLNAFRVNHHLRSRHILEYKDLMKILPILGINKNTRTQNFGLQLIEFDYRKYRYNIDEYAVLYWDILLSSPRFKPHLKKLGINSNKFLTILEIIFQETKNKYPSDPSAIHSKSKFSYVLNLFISCYQLIDRPNNTNTEKSTNDIADEQANKTDIESDLRFTIAEIIFENKMLIGSLIGIDRRFRSDVKFDKLKSELSLDNELMLKIKAEFNQ
ncbi:MAG: hypothetical protein HeimC2_10390 [Candidatus Heimdallarchaeota archaeon LC_2]|nr:MAG: hypothetical protein HeimC2_10390 [Candidatus Heimdallarchaeota archaeon LC_2]